MSTPTPPQDPTQNPQYQAEYQAAVQAAQAQYAQYAPQIQQAQQAQATPQYNAPIGGVAGSIIGAAKNARAKTTGDGNTLGVGLSIALIVGGLAIWIIFYFCTAASGNSMFDFTVYYPSDNVIFDIMNKYLFWPAWIVSVGLVGYGIFQLIKSLASK
ncbi:MAG: hypothetical protein LBR20_07640 [Propionibacteriaceae bacterium]|jgi:hypothetical protein|nr:hypothetical protein [Propionibacteriaceae bacterium]